METQNLGIPKPVRHQMKALSLMVRTRTPNSLNPLGFAMMTETQMSAELGEAQPAPSSQTLWTALQIRLKMLNSLHLKAIPRKQPLRPRSHSAVATRTKPTRQGPNPLPLATPHPQWPPTPLQPPRAMLEAGRTWRR